MILTHQQAASLYVAICTLAVDDIRLIVNRHHKERGGFSVDAESSGAVTIRSFDKDGNFGVPETYDSQSSFAITYDLPIIPTAAVLLAACHKALNTLTDERLGQWRYVEGSQMHQDFADAAETLRFAIAKALK